MALRPLLCLFLSGRLRQVSLYVFKDVLSVDDNDDDKLMLFVVIGLNMAFAIQMLKIIR